MGDNRRRSLPSFVYMDGETHPPGVLWRRARGMAFVPALAGSPINMGIMD